MRIFVVLTGFLLASVSMANNAGQTNSERANMLAVLDTVESANEQVTELLEVYLLYIGAVLDAIGAEQNTVAAWRTQWMQEGKHERITRYLTGRHDNARLWYLSASKADPDRMAIYGLGDVRIGYIEHWHWFNRLVDVHNKIRQMIFSQKLAQMKHDISMMRMKLAKINGDLTAMHKHMANLRTKVQEAKDAVGRMAHRVEAQNLGLMLVNEFLRGLAEGLKELGEAEQALSSN